MENKRITKMPLLLLLIMVFGAKSIVCQNENYAVGQEVCFKTFDTNTWIKGKYKEANTLYDGSRHPHRLTTSTGEWICWDDRIDVCCEKCGGTDSSKDNGGDSSGSENSDKKDSDKADDDKSSDSSNKGVFKPAVTSIDASFKNKMLTEHNRIRKEKGSVKYNKNGTIVTESLGDVVWWDELALSSQAWAEFRIFSGNFVHEKGIGQNTGWWENIGSVEGWENEKTIWNNLGGLDACIANKLVDCGHYSAIVDPRVKYIGCGVVKHDPWVTTVCRYTFAKGFTPINVTIDEYNKNVKNN